MITVAERFRGALWGSVVGDALGVPVEFRSREELDANPVKDMREFGSHNQPLGTWSDDTSMLLGTVDSLIQGWDLTDMARRFLSWRYEAAYTPHGVVFDIGGTTKAALDQFASTNNVNAGLNTEASNGNGSLMRILPLALQFASNPLEDIKTRVEAVSAITHSHSRSKMACVLYVLLVRYLMQGLPKQDAVKKACSDFECLYHNQPELVHFQRITRGQLLSLRRTEIQSTGYVIHTLEASLWSLLISIDFRSCVLQAVNLGLDTDTTGCVAGGLAGACFGIGDIPNKWITQLVKQKDLAQLFKTFERNCLGNSSSWLNRLGMR